MVFQESLKFHVSFKGVSRKIEGCVKVILSGFQVYLNEVLRVCQGSFNFISRKCQRSFKEVSKKFQEWLKEVSMVFQESFKGVSRKIEGFFRMNRAFESSFKGSFKCA